MLKLRHQAGKLFRVKYYWTAPGLQCHTHTEQLATEKEAKALMEQGAKNFGMYQNGYHLTQVDLDQTENGHWCLVKRSSAPHGKAWVKIMQMQRPSKLKFKHAA